jgi:hypothetical protein
MLQLVYLVILILLDIIIIIIKFYQTFFSCIGQVTTYIVFEFSHSESLI